MPETQAETRSTKTGNIIDLKHAEIINSYGESIDIINMIAQINICEDISTPYIYGSILMTDNIGLPEFFQFVGEENLYLEYKSAIEDYEYIQQEFYITDFSPRTRSKPREEIYTISFVSFEYVHDVKTIVNNAYVNQQPHTLVQNIFDKYFTDKLQYTITKDKTLHTFNEIEQSITITPSRRSPFETIQYLCEEIGTTHQENTQTQIWGDFVFFERQDGFHFTSLSALQKGMGGEGKAYFHGFQNVEENSAFTNYIKEKNNGQIIDVITMSTQQERTFNVLEELDSGMYDNRVSTIDTITKLYKETNYSYHTDHRKISTTADTKEHFPVISENTPFHLNDGSSRISYLSSRIIPDSINVNAYKNLPYLKGKVDKDYSLANPRTKHRWLNYKHASFGLLDRTMITITIPGDSNVKAGELVEFYSPLISVFEEHTMETNPFFGNYFGAYFLVMKVEHKYNRSNDNFFTVLQLCKSNYARSIEDVRSFLNPLSQEDDV